MSTAASRRRSGAGSKPEKASRKRQAEEEDDKENSTPPEAPAKGKSPAKKSAPAEVEVFEPASENEEEVAEKKSPAKEKASKAIKGKKGGKKRKSSEGGAAGNESSLYNRIKGSIAPKIIITDWFKAYDDDAAVATLELVNLVVQASGQTKASIDLDTFKEGDMAEVLKNLVGADQKAYREEGGDYPVGSKKKENRKFTKRFLDFWTGLISTANDNGVVFDGYLADTIVAWMTAVSSSSVRPFRHTATLVGLQIVGALIEAAKALRANNDTLEHQLAAEKKKKGNVGPLADRLKKSQSQLTTLEQLVQELYNGIFVHRYRDTVAEVRIACIRALGNWIRSYPVHFLEDKHLKYIAWMLNDRAPEVREAAIEVLMPLYEGKEFHSGLQTFTQRFHKRLVQLTRDRETSVAVRALKLNEELAKVGVLTEEDLDTVYALATDEISALRDAAAAFVAMQLKDGTTDTTELLKRLVAFVTDKSQLPDNPAYIVDAIWNSLPALQDFKSMAELLLSDTQSKKRALSDAETTVLVSVLHSAVRRHLGLNICPKEKPNKPLSDDAREKAQAEVTSQLLEALPQLLRAFQGDADKVAQLAELPQYLLLEDYKKGRKEKAFKDLLTLLREVYQKHASTDVLTAISTTFKRLLRPDFDLFSEVDVSFGRLAEGLDAALERAKTALIDEDEADDDEAIQYGLLVTLQRIDALAAQHKVSAELHGLLDSLFVGRAKFSTTHGDEIGALILRLLLKDLTWSLAAIRDDARKKEIDALRLKRDTLLNNIDAVLRSKTNSVLGTEAFFVLGDLLTLFGSTLRGQEVVAPLAYEAPDDLIQQLVSQFDLIVSDEPTPELIEKTVLLMSRLVSFKLIDSAAAASHVVAHMVGHGDWITEIIKTMIKRHRDADATHRREATIFFDALKHVYERALKSIAAAKKGKKKQAEEHQDDPFDEFKRLGKALSYTYGVGSDKLKEADRRTLLQLHHSSANYALAETEQYRFFEGLQPITSKMPADLATRFVTDLQNIVSRLPEDSKPNESEEQHQPYFDYTAVLEKHAGKARPVARRLALELETLPATTPRTPGVELSVASSAPTSTNKKTPSSSASKGKKKQKKSSTPAVSESEREELSKEEQSEQGLIDRRYTPKRASQSSQSSQSQSSQELTSSSKKKPKMSVPATDITLGQQPGSAPSSGGSTGSRKKRASPAAGSEKQSPAPASPAKGKKKKSK